MPFSTLDRQKPVAWVGPNGKPINKQIQVGPGQVTDPTQQLAQAMNPQQPMKAPVNPQYGDLAKAMIGQGTSTAPVSGNLEAIARPLEALAGVYLQRKQGDFDTKSADYKHQQLAQALGGITDPATRDRVLQAMEINPALGATMYGQATAAAPTPPPRTNANAEGDLLDAVTKGTATPEQRAAWDRLHPAPREPQPTGQLGLYDRYVNDEKAAGHEPMPVADWQAYTAGLRTTAVAQAGQQANAQAALPGAIDTATRGLQTIDKILSHPSRAAATGFVQGALPAMTPGILDFDKLTEQLKSQAFLQAYDVLKGGGAISEAEGRKATEAFAQLDARQSDQQFVDAVWTLRSTLENAIKRAQAKAQGGTAPGGPNAPANAPRVVNFADLPD